MSKIQDTIKKLNEYYKKYNSDNSIYYSIEHDDFYVSTGKSEGFRYFRFDREDILQLYSAMKEVDVILAGDSNE